MPNLEPAYLRYIYDGLIKGNIHPENAAELPDGLIGLYEEAFDERTSVVERQKLLQRFAIWALLKKEVSAAFVAEILGETEDDIQEFIPTYSAWFNSPESGKYQLYHERLKVYLLQKLSEGEVHTLHEKLITRLEQAIEEQKADEFEWYGLEFLGAHFTNAAFLEGKKERLLELCFSKSFRNRQIELSNKFDWSNKTFQSAIFFLNSISYENISEIYLMLVDLKHQEEKSLKQTARLFGEGKFELALDRIRNISSTGYSSQSRQFTGYILCLLEALRVNEGIFDLNNIQAIKDVLNDLEERKFDSSWFMPPGVLLIVYLEAKRIGLNACFLFETNKLNYQNYLKCGGFTDAELFWVWELVCINSVTNRPKEEMLEEFLNSLYQCYSKVEIEKVISKIEATLTNKNVIKNLDLSFFSNNTNRCSKLDLKLMPLNLEIDNYYDSNFETQILHSVDRFIENNSLKNVKNNLEKIIETLDNNFKFGLYEKEDQISVLENIRLELIKKDDFEKAINIISDKEKSGVKLVAKFVAEKVSFLQAKKYLEKLNSDIDFDDIVFEIAIIYLKANRKEEGLNLLLILNDRIESHFAENKRFLYILNLAIELFVNGFKSKSDLILERFLSQFLNLRQTRQIRNIEQNISVRSSNSRFHRIIYRKLIVFDESKILQKFLANNPSINQEYQRYIEKNHVVNGKFNKNEDFDFEIFDFDELNSVANNLSREKLKQMETNSNKQTQVSIWTNRFLFYKDLTFLEDLDIHKHLWCLRFELDELELFLNLFVLNSIFLKDDDVSVSWIEILHLQWAIDIKNQLPN